MRVHGHLGRIIVVLVIVHLSLFYVCLHAVQNGGQLKLFIDAGNRVLVVKVHLDVVMFQEEVEHLVGGLLVFTTAGDAELQVDA